MPVRMPKRARKEFITGQVDQRFYKLHAWWACEIGEEPKASAPTKRDLLDHLGINSRAYRVRRLRPGMYEYEDKERGPNDHVATIYIYSVAAGPSDGFPIEYQSEDEMPASTPTPEEEAQSERWYQAMAYDAQQEDAANEAERQARCDPCKSGDHDHCIGEACTCRYCYDLPDKV